MIYIIIALLLLILSFHYDVNGKNKNKCFWYNFVLVVLIMVAGMRYRVGVDTTRETYCFFNETPTLDVFFEDLSLFQSPLWKLLNSFVFTIGGKWFWVQFIQSAFVNILLFRYFKKHCQYIFTCLFLYYIWLYAAINFEEMKASFAIVLSLYSYDYILEKKYFKGTLLLVIGFLFHFSALIILPLAFMTFLRVNLFGFFLLICSMFLGYILSTRFEDYLFLLGFDDFISGKMETYANSDIFFNREEKGVRFYIIRVLPLLLYPLVSFWFVKKRNKTITMLKLEPYLQIGLCMVALFTFIVIFYRLVNFYIAIFILFISQSIVDIIKIQPKMSIGLSCFRAFILLLLLFLNIGMGYKERIDKFYPYSSVIERNVYKSKEKKFNEEFIVPSPCQDEY